MDSVSVDAVVNNLKLPQPFKDRQNFYILIELSSNDGSHVDNKLTQVLERMMTEEIIVDGTFSSELTNMKKLWSYRERIAEALMKDGCTYKYDVSIPLDVFYEIVEIMRLRINVSSCMKVCGYGHMGDCNLHLNITSKQFDKQILNLIEPYVFEYVSQKNGSISAEHGIGMKKREFLHYSKSKEAIHLMKEIKKLFDPNNILNPHKVLPDS